MDRPGICYARAETGRIRRQNRSSSSACASGRSASSSRNVSNVPLTVQNRTMWSFALCTRTERSAGFLQTHLCSVTGKFGPYRMNSGDLGFYRTQVGGRGTGKISRDRKFISYDAIISKDLNGVIKSWNRGAEQLFGYPAAEAVGRTVTILIPMTAPVGARYSSANRSGQIIDHFDTVRRHKDEHLLDISLTVSPDR